MLDKSGIPKKIYRFQEIAELPVPRVKMAEPLELEEPEKDPWWQKLGRTIFSSPIGLGESVAELFPELKETRAMIEEYRAKGGEWVEIADDMEKKIGQKPTATQVTGQALGTALWATPAKTIKLLKKAPALASFVAGGMYGGGFAVTDAMAEGKKLEEIATAGIMGSMIGAPLGMAGYGVVKFGLKIPGKTAKVFNIRMPEVIKLAIYPIETRLKELGTAGSIIVERFRKASSSAQAKTGELMLKMNEARLVDLPRLFPRLFSGKKKEVLLNRNELWRGDNSVLDVLRGRTRLKATTPRVQDGAKFGRKLFDEIADAAEDSNVLIGRRKNYFTQLTPEHKTAALSKKESERLVMAKTKEAKEAVHLQLHKKESLRRDVLENVVYKERKFKTIEGAASVFDSWIEFVKTGGRITEKTKPFIAYLIKTGQAKNVREAQAKALRDFIHRPLPRLPRYGPLEYRRELDFPFWDPNPSRVLPVYATEAITRIDMAMAFGPKGERMTMLLKDIRKEMGLDVYKRADSLVREIMEQVERAPIREQASLVMRAIQIPKLAFAQILNIGQNTNTLLATDLGSFAYGLQSAFKDKGIRDALRSGAILHSVMNQQLAYIGGGSQFASKALKYAGFTWTELFNRTVASNAGTRYAKITFAKLQKSPANQVLGARLKELKIDSVAALKRGKITEDELLRAGNIMSEMTQFTSIPIALPQWTSSPEGKVLFQFKNFAYHQAKFVKRQLMDPNIPLSRKIRTLFILSTLFPMQGEVLGNVRALITGVKRPTKAWDRYWSNVAMAGTWGLWIDIVESAKWRRFAEMLAGPTISSVSSLVEEFVASIEKGEPTQGFIKSTLAQTGILRPIGNYLYPSRRKNMGDVFEFWEDL